MSRITFREWSIAMGLGDPMGPEYLRARRALDAAMQKLFTQVWQDTIRHGNSIHRLDMGEDCTPIIQRIDPHDFYVHPSDTGERQSDE